MHSDPSPHVRTTGSIGLVGRPCVMYGWAGPGCVRSAGQVEDDSLYDEEGFAAASVPETGYVDEAGELRRPWNPATRILEHREQVGWGCRRVGRRQGAARGWACGEGGWAIGGGVFMTGRARG